MWTFEINKSLQLLFRSSHSDKLSKQGCSQKQSLGHVLRNSCSMPVAKFFEKNRWWGAIFGKNGCCRSATLPSCYNFTNFIRNFSKILNTSVEVFYFIKSFSERTVFVEPIEKITSRSKTLSKFLGSWGNIQNNKQSC